MLPYHPPQSPLHIHPPAGVGGVEAFDVEQRDVASGGKGMDAVGVIRVDVVGREMLDGCGREFCCGEGVDTQGGHGRAVTVGAVLHGQVEDALTPTLSRRERE